MKRKNLEKLEILFEQRQDQILNDLISQDKKDIAEDQIQWLTISEKFLVSLRQSRMRKKIILIGFCSLLVITLLWTVPLMNTKISLQLDSEFVAFKLKEIWKPANEISATEITVKNIMKDETQPLSSLKLEGVENNELLIQNLELHENTEVTLEVVNHIRTISIKGNKVSGSILFMHAKMTTFTENNLKEVLVIKSKTGYPNSIDFNESEKDEDIELQITIEDNVTLTGPNIQNLDFWVETFHNSGEMESKIIVGKLNVLETGGVLDLDKGDSLSLGELKNMEKLKLLAKKNRIAVIFEGTVSKIVSKTKHSKKNVTPSYLQFLFHNKQLELFWLSLIFLMGVIYKLRKEIF